MGETFPTSTATPEELEQRAVDAIEAMTAASELLAVADNRAGLTKHILCSERPKMATMKQANTQIGAFMMATKAMAEALGLNVAVVASAKHDGSEVQVTGVDAWADDLFDLAQRAELCAGAIRQAHVKSLMGQVSRLDAACVEARTKGAEIAGPLFDRGSVKKEKRK